MTMWEEYSAASKRMIAMTHFAVAPWTIIKSNDTRRARIAVIRRILLSIPYKDKNIAMIGAEDEKIIGNGPYFFIKINAILSF